MLDIEMPGMDGIAATEAIMQLGTCKVLIVTTFGRTGYLQRALAAGASGFMVKDAPSEQLARSNPYRVCGWACSRPSVGDGSSGGGREPADRTGAGCTAGLPRWVIGQGHRG